MSDALFNPDAEAALLSHLMWDNTGIDRVADKVSGDDFGNPAHTRIYEGIVRQANLGKPANPLTLRDYFENDPCLETMGGMQYLAELSGMTAPMIMAAHDLAEQVHTLAVRRRMRAGLDTASEACNDLTQPIGEIVSFADGALNTTGKDAIHQPTGGQCFDELIDGFDEVVQGVKCRSIPAIDDLVGAMRPKQLIIGAGRPGMGKTAVALSYALGAARAGHGVLFVSLEMSSRELAARMAADLCFDVDPIPFNFIRDSSLNAPQKRRVAEAGSFMHSLPFQVIDAGSLTVGRLNTLIRRHARRMAAKGHKLELVVVDYLQLMSPDTKGRSNYEAVSEVSRALKAMAKDHDVAVFALAQLSREVEKRSDRRPQLSDLRDSGQIEQDADAVLFLLRDEYYLRQAEPDHLDPKRAEWEHNMAALKGQIEFILAKRRNGTTGTAFGQFHGAYQAVR